MCARVYGSQSGRWLTRDPLALDELDRQPYCYVGNNPPNLADPSGKQPALPTPVQQRNAACAAACEEARQDPQLFFIKSTTVGFTLCMPVNPAHPSVRFACACVGEIVLDEPASVKKCILEHEALHITSGDDICPPGCASPERPMLHPPGYNETFSECRAAAAEIACLMKALARPIPFFERARILFHINREIHYCNVTMHGDIKNHYHGPEPPPLVPF
jgi:hypothetical protein